MFTFIKKRLYIRKKRKEILKAISTWDIAEDTSYAEFRSFITEMKEILSLIYHTENVKEVLKSIPDSQKLKLIKHLNVVLINYYVNLSKQLCKATDIVKIEKLQPETKKYVFDVVEVIHSSKDLVEDTIKDLQVLIAK